MILSIYFWKKGKNIIPLLIPMIIIMLITIHVPPNIFAASVIPLVSINIKPAPKKKHVGEKFFLFIGLVFWIKKKEDINTKKIMNI